MQTNKEYRSRIHTTSFIILKQSLSYEIDQSQNSQGNLTVDLW